MVSLMRALIVALLLSAIGGWTIAHADGCERWGCGQVGYLAGWLTAVGGSNG